MPRRASTKLPGMVADVRTIGSPELIAALSALSTSGELKRAMQSSLRKGATLIARAARQKARKRTGNLRKTIKVGTKANWGRRAPETWKAIRAIRDREMHIYVGIDARVDRGVPAKSAVVPRGKRKGKRRGGKALVNTVSARAGVNEFGTPSMAAQPFIRPAYMEKKEAAVLAIREAVIPAIEREAAKSIVRRARRAELLSRQ